MSRRRTVTRKSAKARGGSTTKPRGTSKLPTGNGYGYAVVHAKSGALIRFFAHPYRFMRPPADVKKEGPMTTDFIKRAVWGSRSSVQSVSYLEQSHITQIIDGKSTAHFFMPFTLQRNALLGA